VIRERRLDDRLGAMGSFVLVGNAAEDLMVARNIDIVRLKPRPRADRFTAADGP
jgi:hypothetical protein